MKVEVKTEGISVDESYVVLKPGEEHQIKATVTPSNAPQSLNYTSSDDSVATVSDSGMISATAPGNASVVVSNGSGKAVISVIVNQSTDTTEKDVSGEGDESVIEESSPILKEIMDGEDGREFFAYSEDLKIVSSEILQALYGTEKTLIIAGKGYHLTICGNDIKNVDNELDTNIQFADNGKEADFCLNEGNNLPGKILIVLEGSMSDYRWLYLYNPSLDRWQLLNSYQNGTIAVDTAGQYSLKLKKITLFGINWWIVAGCGIVILIGVGIFIFAKKKYWFW